VHAPLENPDMVATSHDWNAWAAEEAARLAADDDLGLPGVEDTHLDPGQGWADLIVDIGGEG
jgi:hypothetical protein